MVSDFLGYQAILELDPLGEDRLVLEAAKQVARTEAVQVDDAVA
jgi:hypothetical protein